MTDYRLTDEEIRNIREETIKRLRIASSLEIATAVADAATKKARNETIKEVKAWLGALENTWGIYDNELGFVEISNHVPFSAWTALRKQLVDPNRFFPKEITGE